MAEEKDIAFKVSVDGVDSSVNSIKELKQAIKEATSEQLKAQETFGIGSKEYKKASQNVAELKDKVDDLKDSSKGLQGSGIERASQGFSALGEGLRNLDFDKVKIGLTGLKTALAATGVMLIVQAVSYLVANFEELSQGSGLLAKALQFVGNVVQGAIDLFYKLTDAIGLSNSELDKQGEAIKTNAEKATEALANQTAEYDRQIAIAKASGKSAVDLEKAKQQAIIDTNKALVEQTIAYVRSGGELTEEQNKLLTGQLNAIKNAVAQQQVIDITDKQTRIENYKKYLDEKLRLEQAKDAEDLKRATDSYNYEMDLNKKRIAQAEADRLQAIKDKELANEQHLIDIEQSNLDDLTEYDAYVKLQNDKALIDTIALEAKKAKREEDLKHTLEVSNASLNSASQLNNSLQGLSDAYFALKRQNLQKGSAEDLKQAKKQFDINKALAISSATISTIQGVINALTAQSVVPEPFGTILKVATAASVGITGGLNIAKIASSKFDGGGSASVSSPSVSTPSVPIPSAPSFSTNNNSATGSTFNEEGKNTTQQPVEVNIKSTVSVTEINEKQNNVKVIEAQNKF